MSGKQAIVREVNDRIRELHAGFGVASGDCVVLCECGDPACFERLVIPLGAVEELRARGDQALFTAPGHESVAA